MSEDGGRESGDAVSALLDGLEDRLRAELAHLASVVRGQFLDAQGTSWWVQPFHPRSVPVCWFALGDEVVLQAGQLNRGGRWELARTPGDVDFVEAVVRAAVAGKVVESSALARSQVVVTLEDGRVVSEAGYEGCLSVLIPLPGWRRWGKVVHYEPYASLSQ